MHCFSLFFWGLLCSVGLSPEPFGPLNSCTWENGTVYYNQILGKPIMKDVTSGTDCPYAVTRMLETRLESGDPSTIVIDYDPGPSADDGFTLYRVENGKLVSLGEKIKGTELTVPGDGYLYVLGESNDYFNRKRKYAVTDRRIEEIRQPFYFVGLDTVLREDIILYADQEGDTEVATVRKGEKLTVLLSLTEWIYLAKTEYGLVGWLLDSGALGQRLIIHGD